MLRNKTVLKIFSLVFAFLFWMYIMAEVNPTINRTIRNVPVEILNEQALEEKGLIVKDDKRLTADITFEARRSDFQKIDRRKLTAEVDVKDCRKGTNTVPVTVQVPVAVTLTELNPARIDIDVIVQTCTKEVPLDVEVEGEVPQGYTMDRIHLPKTVKVNGPKKQVDALTELKAKPVDISKLKEDAALPIEIIFPPQIELADGQKVPKALVKVKKTR